MDAVHTAARRTAERPRMVSVGAALVSGAVAMYFAGLLSLYLAWRDAALGSGGVWLDGVTVPLTPGSVMIATLGGAVVMMQWALYAAARDDRNHAIVALGTALVMGGAVINSQYWMYTQMGMGIADSPEAVFVYAITGSFVASLIGGMVYGALATLRAVGGQLGPGRTDSLTGAVVYWYVITLVFAVIWYGVYIVK